MTQTPRQLFEQINRAIEADRITKHELALEAGLTPSTVYDMLRPGWKNRAVDNVEALAVAFKRLATKKRPAAKRAAPKPRGR